MQRHDKYANIVSNSAPHQGKGRKTREGTLTNATGLTIPPRARRIRDDLRYTSPHPAQRSRPELKSEKRRYTEAEAHVNINLDTVRPRE